MTYKLILLAGLPTGTPELLYFHSYVPVENGVPVYWDTGTLLLSKWCPCVPVKHMIAHVYVRESPYLRGGVPGDIRGNSRKDWDTRTSI